MTKHTDAHKKQAREDYERDREVMKQEIKNGNFNRWVSKLAFAYRIECWNYEMVMLEASKFLTATDLSKLRAGIKKILEETTTAI